LKKQGTSSRLYKKTSKTNNLYRMNTLPTDICSEEIAVAPQSFGEMLDIDSFLKTMSEEDLYRSFLEQNGNNQNMTQLESVLPPLQTLPDLSPTTLYNPTMAVIPSLSMPNKSYVAVSQNEALNKRSAQMQVANKSTKKPRVTKDPKVKVPKEDDKYSKRLEANKKSAQASRERKKALKAELEIRLEFLTQENAELLTEITVLETENRVLKNEFMQLQNMVNESALASKLMAKQLSADLPAKFESEDPKATNNAAAAFYLMFLLSVGQTFMKNPVSVNSPVSSSITVL